MITGGRGGSRFRGEKRNLAETKSEPAQKQPDPQSISIKVEPYPEGDNGEPSYRFPPVSLLDPSPETDEGDVTHELQTYGQMLVDTLKSFGVQTKIVDISRGPAVTRYELQPAAGVKISKITNLADDIALNLAASASVSRLQSREKRRWASRCLIRWSMW